MIILVAEARCWREADASVIRDEVWLEVTIYASFRVRHGRSHLETQLDEFGIHQCIPCDSVAAAVSATFE